ncbi:hypothetical protein BD289DRAFT_481619 [Coniella lustricola]|uniref:DUF7514 domain-containing protein n=1 Tax=Coniella lustricola TaxID=2025994 RepID=A0A2T3ABI9_9PEZI|nr:hypothetical protein BD289DRAFT_481619 [Coniella lustricola]
MKKADNPEPTSQRANEPKNSSSGHAHSQQLFNARNAKVRSQDEESTSSISLSTSITTPTIMKNTKAIRRLATSLPAIVALRKDGTRKVSLDIGQFSSTEDEEEENQTITEPRKLPLTHAPQQLTTIDKIWVVLFQTDAKPTTRMQDVALGVANYIVQEFPPQHSIIVTPNKMAAFYSQHSLKETTRTETESDTIFRHHESKRIGSLPFTLLFESHPLKTPATKSSRMTFYKALARFYDALGCQYFLVPDNSRSYPTVPSLTPRGFAHWLITVIQAYRDAEARWLDHMVATLPIEVTRNHAASSFGLRGDEKAQRLPKQVSRHLLLAKPECKIIEDPASRLTE